MDSLSSDSVVRGSREKLKDINIFLAFGNHLSLISDTSEAQILTSSFDWTIAICSIK